MERARTVPYPLPRMKPPRASAPAGPIPLQRRVTVVLLPWIAHAGLLAHLATIGRGVAQDAPLPPGAVAAAPNPKASASGSLEQGADLELSLASAIELALQNNLGLKIEQLATEVTFYNERGSWGAFDWVLGATANVQDREFESTSVFGGSSENTQGGSIDLVRPNTLGGRFQAHFETANTETDSTFAAQEVSTTDVLQLSYTQPLLRGAWREYSTVVQREADLAWKRQTERERQVRHNLIRDVSNAYWDLVLARAQLEVARSSLELAQAQLDQDKKRLDAGIGVQLDVYAAETEVSTNEERVLAADVRVRQTADALKRLLFPGRNAATWDTALVPSTPLVEEVSTRGVPNWTDALEVALDKRAELRQQRLAIEESVVRQLARESERRPQLDLELTAGGTGFDGDSADAFESASTFEFPTYRAALVFSFPIGNRTARYAAKAAWANVRAARLTYDQTETQIVGEVREAVRQATYQAEAVRAARKSLDLAQRQLAAEQAKRQEGISTNFEVLRLQRDLTTALTNERNARANFAKAWVELKAAQGLLGEAAGL